MYEIQSSSIRRDLLDRPVREYADNLREQVYVIWRKLGVKDVQEFDRVVREKKVVPKDAEEVRDLLRRLRDAVQKNEVPIDQERFERGKEMFEKAFDILKEIRNSEYLARASVDVAQEYRAAELPVSAELIRYLSLSAGGADEVSPATRVDALLAYADEVRAAGHDPVDIYESALEQAKIKPNPYSLSATYLRIAEHAIAAGVGLWTKAVDLARESADFYEDTLDAINTLNLLVEFEIRNGRDPSRTFSLISPKIGKITDTAEKTKRYFGFALLQQKAGLDPANSIRAAEEIIDGNLLRHKESADCYSLRSLLAARSGEDPAPHFEAAVIEALGAGTNLTDALFMVVGREIDAKQFSLAEKHVENLSKDHYFYAFILREIAHALSENGLPAEPALRKAWDAAQSIMLSPVQNRDILLSILKDSITRGYEYRPLVAAVRHAVDAFTQSREDIPVLTDLAVTLARAKDPEAAVLCKEAYDRADALTPPDYRARTLEYFATLAVKGGFDDLAEQAIDEAIESVPLRRENETKDHRLWELARSAAQIGAEMIRGATHRKK